MSEASSPDSKAGGLQQQQQHQYQQRQHLHENSSNSDTDAIERRKSRHEEVEADEKKSINMDDFPWLTEFQASCKCWLGQRDPLPLINLIKLFNRNVSSNFNDCCKRPSQAAKLKESIKETLLLFTYFYRHNKPQAQNEAVYFELMSDLLAMYIDLELVVSKRDAQPQFDKISSRIVSYLCLYLENSTEYMLDTLMQIQLANETHSRILSAVISKIFKLIPARPETAIMYVRYLLVYRLWKKVHDGDAAVKKQINANAISSLRSAPQDLPAILLEQVLPSATTQQHQPQQQQQQLATSSSPPSSPPSEPKSTKFYLCQHFDLRRACNQFLRYCRKSRSTEETEDELGDITERDQRLKNTLTPEANNVKSVNIEFSNSLNSNNKSNSMKNVVNIPFDKLDIDSNKKTSSTSVKNSNIIIEKNSTKPSILFKKKTSKNFKDIVLIDLTDDDGVTKIIKQKKRPKIAWLEEAKRNIDKKIKEAALSKEIDTITTSLKTKNHELEDSSRRLSKSTDIACTELESKLSHTSNSSINVETDNNLDKQFEDSGIVRSKEKNNSSPPDSSSSKIVRNATNKTLEETDDAKSSLVIDSMTNIQLSDSKIVTSSKILRLEEKQTGTSALHDADVLTEDKQPADSTVSSVDALKEVSSSVEEQRSDVYKDINVDDLSTSAAVTTAFSSSAAVSVIENFTSNTIESRSIKYNASKTDYSNEQKVQQASIVAKKDLSNINESHIYTENEIIEKEIANVNSEQINKTSSSTGPNKVVEMKRKNDVNSINKQFQVDNSVLPTTSNSLDDIQESDIDGLTLLARVSARMQISTSQKADIKVKPYSSLQQKPKNDIPVSDCLVTTDSNNIDKVSLQIKISPPEVVSSTVNKQHQQQQVISTTDSIPYAFEDSIHNNSEYNDNANAILNGETVMLLPKPNSKYFIINKAVDNLSSGKVNYNRDDEDMKKTDYEDIKCYQQGMLIKHEPDDLDIRSRGIKPDPDYMDIKSSTLIHEEKEAQSLDFNLHYAGYPILPAANYCTNYANMHRPSTACACVNCAYHLQTVRYYPPHVAPSVQTNSTVQEKRCNKKTEAAALLDRIYDEQLSCNGDKYLADNKQQPEKAVEMEKEVSKFEHYDRQLPLKKRLKAQRMMPVDFAEKQLLQKTKLSPTYPGTLMMSIADVEIRSEKMPHDVGAMVEVSSAEPTKNRSRKSKKLDGKINNQNVPNCFPRKNGSKEKCKLASIEEEVENSGISAAKKVKRSNGVDEVKQTRSSKRGIRTVNYMYSDIDPEWNPGKRRKRKNRR